jgi:hypothetical protein
MSLHLLTWRIKWHRHRHLFQSLFDGSEMRNNMKFQKILRMFKFKVYLKSKPQLDLKSKLLKKVSLHELSQLNKYDETPKTQS